MSDLVGKSLGKYHLVARVGQGGMAEVYRAYQPSLDRYVAIKVLHSHLAGETGLIGRFEREATAVARLRHANIVQVYDFDIADELYYMVMEFIAGPTLKAELRERHLTGQGFTLAETIGLFNVLASAIDYAHTQGVIHRDLKPANVMLTTSGQVVLTDFGIARLIDATRYTMTGAIAGTPAYMSPEQGRGHEIDGRSDIYSLGVMLYELATGRIPFDAPTPLAIIVKHISESLPRPTLVNPTIPETVEQVILKAMSKTPANRYQAAGDMAQALQAAVRDRAQVLPTTIRVIAKTTAPILALDATVASTARRGLAPAEPAVSPSQKPALSEADLPFDLEKMPRSDPFVGRVEELAAYRSHLALYNFAIIEGMAGMGKTALGAELAGELAQAGWKVFWLTLIPGVTDNIEEFVARLAGFVAVVGQNDKLWQMINIGNNSGQIAIGTNVVQIESIQGGEVNIALQAETADGPSFSLGQKFELFLKSAEANRYVLCLDDFHVVADDERFQPLFQLLGRRFGRRRQDHPLKLIIMGRQIPDSMAFLRAKYDELRGLSLADARIFLNNYQVRLTAEQLARLHQRTEGNSEMLNLSIRRLQQLQHDPAQVEQFIANLQHQNQIQALLTDLSRSLAPEERLTLSAIALFRSAAVARSELETVLVEEEEVTGLREHLHQLVKWHAARQTEEGKIFLHDLVREYAYANLDAAPRRRMQARAGRYFEDMNDYIEAAYHYFEARQFDAAAAALAGRTRLLVNQGHWERLGAQLARLGARRHDLIPDHWLVVVEGLGDVDRARSDYEAAIKQFKESIRLREERGNDPAGLARTYNKLADVYMLQGDFAKVAETGIFALERAIAAGDKAEEARAHLMLGVAYYEQGDAELAATTHQQSLAMAQALGDANLMARSYMELAMDYERLNRYQEAVEHHRQSLKLFLNLGNTFRATAVYSNLGGNYQDQGLFKEALTYYRQGLALAVENSDTYNIVVIKGNMGEVYAMLGDYSQAESYLQEALVIARSIGQVHFLAIFTADLAEVKLALGDSALALEQGLRALELARETGQQPQEGVAHRVLGEVYTRMADRVRAETHLRTAVEILEQLDLPVEEAKAKRSYGEFLLRADEPTERDEGTAYLQQAATILEAVEATKK